MENGAKGQADGTAPEAGVEPQGDADGFKARFNAALLKWRTEGCPSIIVKDESGAGDHQLCGAPPLRAQVVQPEDAVGMVDFIADCAKGHKAVWKFRATEAEVKEDAVRQQQAHQKAQAEAGKAGPKDEGIDPFTATITIKMNVRTQDVTIEDLFVPNPGAAAMMCLIAQHHFLNKLGVQKEAGPKGPGLYVPGQKKLVGPGGKPLS